MTWRRLLWWYCIALVLGVVAYSGCGGRISQDADCWRYGATWKFCPEDVICCPGASICGDEYDDAGHGCPRGYCCHAPDAGDGYTPYLMDYEDETVGQM